MTTPVATSGYKFTFWVSPDNSSWIQIGSVIKMVESTSKREKVDLQVALDDKPNSAAGRCTEATCKFSIAYDVTDTGAGSVTGTLGSYYDQALTVYWKIDLPPFAGSTPAGVSSFQGWIESFDLLVDADEVIGADINIQKVKTLGLLTS